jgi:hypothetical protein
MIDLYRRCGRFQEAAEICDKELEKQHPSHTLDILCFERDLIEKKDIASHSETEAEEADF